MKSSDMIPIIATFQLTKGNYCNNERSLWKLRKNISGVPKIKILLVVKKKPETILRNQYKYTGCSVPKVTWGSIF